MNASGHFADLLMVIDSFKRGDYWAAVGRLLATLNAFVNGSQGAGPGPLLAAGPGGVAASRFSVGGQPSGEDWDSVLGELEGMASAAESRGDGLKVSAPNPDASRVDSVAAGFSNVALIALIKLVLEIFSQFRTKPQASAEGENGAASEPAKKTPVTSQGGNKTASTLPASTGGK